MFALNLTTEQIAGLFVGNGLEQLANDRAARIASLSPADLAAVDAILARAGTP